jgi:hypothetical protein
VALNSRPMGCWGDDYGGTRDAYINNHYEDVLQGVPVMAYPLCTGAWRRVVCCLHESFHTPCIVLQRLFADASTIRYWCMYHACNILQG